MPRSPAGSPGTLNVTFANLALELPGIVTGTVTAPGLASDGTTRVIEFNPDLTVEAR